MHPSLLTFLLLWASFVASHDTPKHPPPAPPPPHYPPYPVVSTVTKTWTGSVITATTGSLCPKKGYCYPTGVTVLVPIPTITSTTCNSKAVPGVSTKKAVPGQTATVFILQPNNKPPCAPTTTYVTTTVTWLGPSTTVTVQPARGGTTGTVYIKLPIPTVTSTTCNSKAVPGVSTKKAVPGQTATVFILQPNNKPPCAPTTTYVTTTVTWLGPSTTLTVPPPPGGTTGTVYIKLPIPTVTSTTCNSKAVPGVSTKKAVPGQTATVFILQPNNKPPCAPTTTYVTTTVTWLGTSTTVTVPPPPGGTTGTVYIKLPIPTVTSTTCNSKAVPGVSTKKAVPGQTATVFILQPNNKPPCAPTTTYVTTTVTWLGPSTTLTVPPPPGGTTGTVYIKLPIPTVTSTTCNSKAVPGVSTKKAVPGQTATVFILQPNNKPPCAPTTTYVTTTVTWLGTSTTVTVQPARGGTTGTVYIKLPIPTVTSTTCNSKAVPGVSTKKAVPGQTATVFILQPNNKPPCAPTTTYVTTTVTWLGTSTTVTVPPPPGGTTGTVYIKLPIPTVTSTTCNSKAVPGVSTKKAVPGQTATVFILQPNNKPPCAPTTTYVTTTVTWLGTSTTVTVPPPPGGTTGTVYIKLPIPTVTSTTCNSKAVPGVSTKKAVPGQTATVFILQPNNKPPCAPTTTYVTTTVTWLGTSTTVTVPPPPGGTTGTVYIKLPIPTVTSTTCNSKAVPGVSTKKAVPGQTATVFILQPNNKPPCAPTTTYVTTTVTWLGTSTTVTVPPPPGGTTGTVYIKLPIPTVTSTTCNSKAVPGVSTKKAVPGQTATVFILQPNNKPPCAPTTTYVTTTVTWLGPSTTLTVPPPPGGTTGTVYIKLPIPTVTSTTCNSKAVPGVSTKKAVPGQTATVFILQPNNKPPCAPTTTYVTTTVTWLGPSTTLTVPPPPGGTTGTVYIKLPIPTVTSTTCNSKAVPGVSTKKAVPGQTATVFILQPNNKPPCAPTTTYVTTTVTWLGTSTTVTVPPPPGGTTGTVYIKLPIPTVTSTTCNSKAVPGVSTKKAVPGQTATVFILQPNNKPPCAPTTTYVTTTVTWLGTSTTVTVPPPPGGTTGTVYIKLPIPTVTSTTCNSKAVPGVSTKKAVPGQTATVFILQPNDKPPCRPPVGLAVPAAAPLAIEVQANSASTTEDAIATTQPTLSSDVSTSTGVAEVAPEAVGQIQPLGLAVPAAAPLGIQPEANSASATEAATVASTVQTSSSDVPAASDDAEVAPESVVDPVPSPKPVEFYGNGTSPIG